MNNKVLTQIGHKARWLTPIVLTCICVWSLSYLLGKVSPAQASSTYYVEGSTGQDLPTCGSAISPCRTIGFALTAATGGDVINVAQGVYTENLTITHATELNGGFSGAPDWTHDPDLYQTTVRASSVGQPVVMFDAGSEGAVLDGFTVTKGDAYEGGGLRVNHVSNITVRHCTITDNAADYDGGGIQVASDGGLLLEASVVSSNTARTAGGGGIIVDNGAMLVVTGTLISDNSAYEEGGGIKVHRSSNFAYISNSTISRNRVLNGNGGGFVVENYGTAYFTNTRIVQNEASNEGGGITVQDNSMVRLTNASILSNTAATGGGLQGTNHSDVVVANSIIRSNYALLHGGGIEVANSTFGMTNTLAVSNTAANINVLAINNSAVTIQNSTIADNNPQGAQAILAFDPATSTLAIRDSILWNNALNIQWDGPKDNVSVTYSDIFDPEGWWTGTGNINADPLFVGGGDYHLQMNSPCIDTGTNIGAPDHDLDQNSRPLDGDSDGTATTDMGAYEFRLYQIYLPLTLRNLTP